jgi:hypothetical protein
MRVLGWRTNERRNRRDPSRPACSSILRGCVAFSASNGHRPLLMAAPITASMAFWKSRRLLIAHIASGQTASCAASIIFCGRMFQRRHGSQSEPPVSGRIGVWVVSERSFRMRRCRRGRTADSTRRKSPKQDGRFGVNLIPSSISLFAQTHQTEVVASTRLRCPGKAVSALNTRT